MTDYAMLTEFQLDMLIDETPAILAGAAKGISDDPDYRKAVESLAAVLGALRDRHANTLNEVGRLRSNFEWLDRIERDNGNDGMRRYFKFRQRSEDIGVLAAIEEFRAEEGEAG